MTILSFNINEPGQAGVFPSMIRIQTNNTLAQVLVTGFLDEMFSENVPLQNGMMALVSTKPSVNSSVVNTSWLEVKFASGHWTLTPTAVAPSSIALPTIVNHMAVFTDTVGSLGEDTSVAINGGNIQAGLSGTAGYVASFPATLAKGSLRLTAVANTGDTLVTLSNALHGQASVYSIPDSGASTANFIVSKTTGTQSITVGSLAVTAGNISAGSSGSAGTLSSFPTTALKGSFKIAAVDNTGDTLVTLSNVAHGQASVYSIPDVGNALGRVLVGATATPFTTGHLLSASGTGGVIADSGIVAANVQSSTNIKAVTTGNIGGAGAGPITVTQAACTSSSVIMCQVQSSSNPCYVITVVPGTGSFTVTTNTDPGASLILSYVLFVAAQ
jgi:hypothetical protein